MFWNSCAECPLCPLPSGKTHSFILILKKGQTHLMFHCTLCIMTLKLFGANSILECETVWCFIVSVWSERGPVDPCLSVQIFPYYLPNWLKKTLSFLLKPLVSSTHRLRDIYPMKFPFGDDVFTVFMSLFQSPRIPSILTALCGVGWVSRGFYRFNWLNSVICKYRLH